MKKQQNMMKNFEFLLGNWNLEYKIPKSKFSKAGKGKGSGTFKRALNDKYVYFDYSATFTAGTTAAHAIFAWDKPVNLYRFWWFEDSGSFQTATCSFINKETLFLNWHDTLLIQTFKKVNANKVILKMENPLPEGKYETILKVILTRADKKITTINP